MALLACGPIVSERAILSYSFGFFTLVPLVSPHYLLLPLVFLVTQFYPTLVPFAHKCAWTPSPSTLTLLTGWAHYKLSLSSAQQPLLPRSRLQLSLSPSPSTSSATQQPASSPGWLLLHRRGGLLLRRHGGLRRTRRGGLPGRRICGRTDLRRLADLRTRRGGLPGGRTDLRHHGLLLHRRRGLILRRHGGLPVFSRQVDLQRSSSWSRQVCRSSPTHLWRL
jgi:hypothetical protein